MASESKHTMPEGALWRRFPQMENIFDKDGREAVMRKIEKTCRRLDEIARTGAAQEQARARAALAAYGRALELLDELGKTREAMAAAQK